MSAELTLDLPWVQADEQSTDLSIRRGRQDMLAYEDGIVLGVEVLDPSRFESVVHIVEAARSSQAPGRVVLVAGAVPIEWRSHLRGADVSFVDVSGVAEIRWPRLHVVAKKFGRPVKRKRNALSFQKGHSLVVQELLIATSDGVCPTIGELASGADISLSATSRAVTKLASHGLVTKHRDGRRVRVEVVDRVAVATQLAERTSWPGKESLAGYLWGRTVFDVAARTSDAAGSAGIDLAVTGRTGAAYYGVLGTSSPRNVRCWVTTDRVLDDIAGELGLEPAAEDSANVVLSADPWRIGLHHRRVARFDDLTASVAHPLRVWCDLHDERRGVEYAAHLWGALTDGE